MKQKVFCMMSGGVDSSVAAALLVREGYDVTGVFMKNWSPNNLQSLTDCPWEQDQKDAEMVCQRLDIPFRSVNFEAAYREKVIEYFFAEYKLGRTPNPDVMCNREIKFGIFLEWARDQGADFVASGHYVRIKHQDAHMGASLHRGIDANKDQSYFLWTLTERQLKYCLFPIGDLQKREVRKIAADLNLATAKKKDSQGICFIGAINVGQFLRSEIGRDRLHPVSRGKVIGLNQKVWGGHDGVVFYTIGQRHGFKLNDQVGKFFADKQIPPLYVVDKDLKKNRLYLGLKDDQRLFSQKLLIGNLNWIEQGRHALVGRLKSSNETTQRLVSTNGQLSAQIRYRQKPVPCTVQGRDAPRRVSTIIFQKPVWAANLGQSLVLYKGDQVVGGGVIEKVVSSQ